VCLPCISSFLSVFLLIHGKCYLCPKAETLGKDKISRKNAFSTEMYISL
jgi:hypothetical protein